MSQRLAYFDNLKGFAILLVVLGHCIQSGDIGESYLFLFNLIYAFHMPLFMVVSGYFGYKNNIDLFSATKKKFVRLLVPYFAWGGLIVIVHKAPPIQLIISPDSYLWFLWDLFFISLIVNSILSLLNNSKPIYTFFVLAIFSVVILGAGKFIPTNDFNIKSICWMFQFYVAGAAYRVYGEKLKANKLVGLLMVIVFIVLFWFKYTFMSLEGLIVYVVSTFVAYLACFACLILFRACVKENTPLAILGQSTLGVYAVHQELIKACSIDNVWILFIVVLFLSVVSVYLIRKSYYLNFLIGE